MKKPRCLVVVLFVLLAFVLPSNGCGPFVSTAEFVATTGPDGTYASYLKGRVGVPQATYRLRYLVAAYDWANGYGLTAGEQKQMVALDTELAAGGGYVDQTNGRAVPGSQYETYVNCLPDAMATAAQTQKEREAVYAGDRASVADWERGQAVVFANCTGSGKKYPEPAAANAPVWLKQDREYQMAAAKFYTEDYDGAIGTLKGIVADKSSPWRDTARVVIARAMIRRATIGTVGLNAGLETYEQQVGVERNPAAFRRFQDDLQQKRGARLSEARDALRAIMADPSMQRYHATAARLLDFVMVRLDPSAQGQVLAARVMGANRSQRDGQFRQAVIDLGYVLGPGEKQMSIGIFGMKSKAENSATEFAWLQAMKDARPATDENAGDSPATHTKVLGEAVAGWRRFHTMPWLMVALTVAKPGDAVAGELAKEASGVPEGSAMWVAATYHRLRLTVGEAGTRGELDALMPGVEKVQSRSTVNLFKALRERTSPTLEAFLRDAGTLPAAIDDGEDDGSVVPDAKRISEGLCGARGTEASTRLFDHEAATVLNTRMPLAMLAEAAESQALAANLRYQIAQSVWTRAVLLGRPQVAKAMSPVLVGCYPAWKPWVEKYDAAVSAEDRRAAGLLAMMRFASTEPIVRDGLQRTSGFAAYDSYRDNWWQESRTAKAAVEGGAKTMYRQAVVATFFGTLPTSREEMADPPFVAAGDRVAAESEVAALGAVPCASDYFAQAALEWQKAHPEDARTPDILGFAQRVVRNGCRTDATKELNHRMFVVTQTKYPKSEWAKRYTSWE